jgi:hypothetical protein
VVPTGQAIGLTGAPSPIGAPARSFDGYLLQAPCLDTNCDVCWSAGWVYEGIATPCNDTFGIDAIQNFTVGGVPGAHYRVTLHFYGVVEPKAYGDAVTRVSGTTRPVNLDSGANPPPLAYAIGEPTPQQTFYGTYEVHVIDNTGAVACSYFLNSDTGEGHYTYVLNFQRTIDVIGGGRLRVRSRSTVPCQIIKNCFGGGTTGECTPTGCFGKTRQVDLSSANPPPTGLVQPGLGNDDSNSGQWIFIDVTNVTCGQSPLACGGT